MRTHSITGILSAAHRALDRLQELTDAAQSWAATHNGSLPDQPRPLAGVPERVFIDNGPAMPVMSAAESVKAFVAESDDKGARVFQCPALERRLTIRQCAQNLIRRAEEPCSPACPMGAFHCLVLGIPATSMVAGRRGK